MSLISDSSSLTSLSLINFIPFFGIVKVLQSCNTLNLVEVWWFFENNLNSKVGENAKNI
jgi:hypothetical protein